MSRARLFIPVLIILFVAGGCDKRAPLRTDLEVAEELLKSRTVEFATLQDESKALNATLGAKYSSAGGGQIERLKGEITNLQARVELLKKQREAAAARLSAMRAETATYLNTHGKK